MSNSELASGDIYKQKNTIPLDFSDVSDGFVTLPAGVYPAVVTKCDPKNSKGGKPMLEWEYTVDTPEHRNVTQRDWTSLEKQAMWKLKGVLQALGYPIAEDGSCDFDPEGVIGTLCQIEVTNTTQNKVKDGVPVIGPDGEPEKVTFANVKAVLPAREGQTPSGLV